MWFEAIPAGGDQDLISEAQQLLIEGDALRSLRKYKDVVNKYKKTPCKSESAIP